MKQGSNDLQLLSINTCSNSYRRYQRQSNYIFIESVQILPDCEKHTVAEQKIRQELSLGPNILQYLRRLTGLGKSGTPGQVRTVSSPCAPLQTDGYVKEKCLSFDLFTFVLSDGLRAPPKDRTFSRDRVRMWAHLHK